MLPEDIDELMDHLSPGLRRKVLASWDVPTAPPVKKVSALRLGVTFTFACLGTLIGLVLIASIIFALPGIGVIGASCVPFARALDRRLNP